MTIASFPKMGYSERNPYLYLLGKALEKEGVRLAEDSPPLLTARWLIGNRSKVDVLHFHWLQIHYVNIEKRRLSVSLALRFYLCLLLARFLGYRIVWTMHNAVPHENAFPKTDRLLRRHLVACSHAIITHSAYGRDILKKTYGRSKGVFVSPHPHYRGEYPENADRAGARARLGLKKELVFVYIGELRHYKGVDTLLKAYAEFQESDSRLLIRGKPFDPSIRKRIEELAAADCRVRAEFEFLPGEELQYYFNAADVVVFPFKGITMSGSLILAMGFGKAVIAPAIGGLPEFLEDGIHGILYDPSDEKGLLKALKRSAGADLPAMSRAAGELVKGFTWEGLAAVIRQAYSVEKETGYENSSCEPVL